MPKDVKKHINVARKKAVAVPFVLMSVMFSRVS